MKRNYVWILFAVVCLMVTLGVYEVDYYKYLFCKKSYTISLGKISQVDEYLISFRGQGGFVIRRAVVSYNVNGTEYTAFDIPISYKETEGSVISVAINKKDYTNILRCEFLPLSRGVQALDVFALLILLYNLIKPPVHMHIKKKKEKQVLRQLNDDNVQKQRDLQLQIIEKQKKILSFCNAESAQILRNVTLSEVEHRMGVIFNESFKWCMLNLPQIIIDSEMPMLKRDKKQFAFELETLYLREKGLPYEYYVIDKKDTYYLCCNGLEERVFAFSEGLGITKTSYADIYDYILEKI